MKTNIVPTAIGSWGVAISATASYDLLTRENTALFVTVPATLRVSNVVRINLNAGWQLDRVTNHNYFTYGAGFDWRTPDNVWTLTGEVFGQAGAGLEQPGLVEPRFQLGLRYRPVDLFNIDLIYGRNLAGERANWITLRDHRPLQAAGKISRHSAPQDAAERAAHDRAADRAAHLAADRLAEVGRDLAGDAVGHRAGDLAGDRLARRQSRAARPVGAEDAAEQPADPAQHAAAGRRFALRRAGRCRARPDARSRATRFCSSS